MRRVIEVGSSGAVSEVGKDAVYWGKIGLHATGPGLPPRGALRGSSGLSLGWSSPWAPDGGTPVCPGVKTLCSSFSFLFFLPFLPNGSLQMEPTGCAVWLPACGRARGLSHLDSPVAVQAERLSVLCPGNPAFGAAGRAREGRDFGHRAQQAAPRGPCAPRRTWRTLPTPALPGKPCSAPRPGFIASAAPGFVHGPPDHALCLPRPVMPQALMNKSPGRSRPGLVCVRD